MAFLEYNEIISHFSMLKVVTASLIVVNVRCRSC